MGRVGGAPADQGCQLGWRKRVETHALPLAGTLGQGCSAGGVTETRERARTSERERETWNERRARETTK